MLSIFQKSQKRLSEIKRQKVLQEREIERNVVSTLSRGNISLQRGEYITREDMDTLQDELINYFSSEQSQWR